MTLAQLAGLKLAASEALLPAAITTTEPRLTAPLMAFCIVAPHVPLPPRLRLRTRDGVAFAGTPATVPPDAQMMASAISEV